MVKGRNPLIALFLLVFCVFASTGVSIAADAGTATSGLVAQTQAAPEAAPDNGDPLEPMNRVILDINEFFMDLLFRPLAKLYVTVLPDFLLDGIHNALNNLSTPVILANDILQFEPERAWITTQRFFINSTIGIGGMMDVAKDFGIEGHKEDLGQTFAVWGVPEGFYLVLPLFGPSNPRDAVGLALTQFIDPISYWAENTHREEIIYGRAALTGVDEFSRVMDDLEKLKETSIDYYAALRSIARQKREAEISNGAQKKGAPLPDLNYDFNAEFSQ